MEIKPSLHETEFKNCFGIYSKNQNLKFDKKFYDKLVELNFFVKEVCNNDEIFIQSLNSKAKSIELKTDFNKTKSFDLVTSFNNNDYHLNPKIYEYIYDELESTITNFYFSDIEHFNEEIKLKLECFRDKVKKNDFLESLKFNITNTIEDTTYYQNYKEIDSLKTMNFGSWKEFVKYTLSYEEEIILDFLFGNMINISKFQIWEDWGKFYLIDNKFKVIDQKLDEINLEKLKSKHSLFKDNAEAFIEYIVNNTNEKINTGFYTCLYYFLVEKRIINSYNQTSDTEYCRYIKKNYLNESELAFSRLNQVDIDKKGNKFSKTLDYFREEYSIFMNKI